MKIEITPEDSRLVCELLSAHRARTIQSLEKFCNGDRSKLSEHCKEDRKSTRLNSSHAR